MATKHLLVDLSSHGFGHFAQTSMVLNALHRLDLPIRVTLRSTLPEKIIQERLEMPVTIIRHTLDIGMVMHNAVDVDAKASYDYYHSFHKEYEQAVKAEVEQLQALKPDLLFANVPYASLSAAAELNIPSIAMCSLNWAEIFAGFCQSFDGADKIIGEIRQAYSTAVHFLAVTPFMPMPELHNTHPIPPITHHGQNQTDTLRLMVEATVNKIPVVCIERGNWPEEPALFDWVRQQGYLQTIQMNDLKTGCFANKVEQSLKTVWQKSPAQSNGAEVAASLISEYLK